MYFRWWQLKLPFFVEPSATISTWKWVVASKFVQAVFSLSCCIQTIRYDIFCGSKQIRGNLLSELFNPLKVCVLRLQSCRKHYMVGRLVVLLLVNSLQHFWFYPKTEVWKFILVWSTCLHTIQPLLEDSG